MNTQYYTPLAQAKSVHEDRVLLRKEVEQFWQSEGLEMETYAKLNGFAGFARQVPTFRMEDAVFVTMARAVQMEPVWMGYVADKFSTLSSTKRSYLQPSLWARNSGNGQPIVAKKKMCDVNAYVGARLNTVQTKEGESMVDWHRKRLKQIVPNAQVVDDSDWMLKYGSPERYYETFLSVFVAHGVLFEDYHGGESGEKLDSFTTDIFEPTVERLQKRFGVGPNLVRMPWHSEMGLYPEGDIADSWNMLALKYIPEQDL